MTSKERASSLKRKLSFVAPGTPLREGIDHVLKANTGGLIVVGYNDTMKGLMDGGFRMDYAFTPSALYELSKMDGAIVLTDDGGRILYANTQLSPAPSIGTSETGMRHRTAERVAIETGKLVIAISQRRQVITLYQGVEKYVLRDIGIILTKANQAMQTLEKYKVVLEQAMTNLSALEFEGMVTYADVLLMLHRIEMLMQIKNEMTEYVMELGEEGRLVRLQLKELLSVIEKEVIAFIQDYCNAHDTEAQHIMDRLQEGKRTQLMMEQALAKLMHFPAVPDRSKVITPRGYRILLKVPRLPAASARAIARRFQDLNQIIQMPKEKFTQVEGIGEVRAKNIIKGLERLREQVMLDRSL
ncbi:DNA integrity scanning protein DisA [Bacillaceae bacterium SIJ1]|uniref:DNA integrity scanning diadenylate cyclase DisA n=1 Tax=Litoribacterium kuwaitense TaxID=1398745 RepID=UPI0013EA4FFD|nr:DNA integrity scanning diadenylate cyclase DisA [Litoribacterium kuwaitense]NGP46720.1 DNA integrity scanning protein DisA [Litoribacterium kuwaitense]